MQTTYLRYEPFTVLLLALLLLGGCADQGFDNKLELSVQNRKKSYSPGDRIAIDLKENTGKPWDSVAWFKNGAKINGSSGVSLSRKLTNNPKGKLTFTAKAYRNDQMAEGSTTINMASGLPAKKLSYRLVNIYPHDYKSFTQGLEFYGDSLYESTGLKERSKVRITDVQTGNVYKEHRLDDQLFGEGLTIMGDRVIQLTYQSGIGLVYDLSLNYKESFRFGQSREGWGLCNDGEFLYKSDGSGKIWRLDPNTYEELDYVSVSTDKSTNYKNLNELEYVDGKIYANVYKEKLILVIEPQSGSITGFINTEDLLRRVEPSDDPKYPPDVLNGIAYDKKTGHLFITGKHWDKMFEIAIEE